MNFEKNLIYPGEGALLHHCSKSEENLIRLKYWQLIKFINILIWFFKNCQRENLRTILHFIQAKSGLYLSTKLQENSR